MVKKKRRVRVIDTLHGELSLKSRGQKNRDFQFYAGVVDRLVSFSRHSHDFWEIQYIYSGRGIHRIDDYTYEIRPHDFFIIPPLVPHECLKTGNNIHKHASLAFYPEMLTGLRNVFDANLFLDAIRTNRHYRYQVPLTMANDIETSITVMLHENLLKSGGYENIIRFEIIKLLTYYQRWLSQGEIIIERFKGAHAIVLIALQKMEAEYDTIHTTEDILRGYGINKKYFLRLFKRDTSYTPIIYLNRLRIEKSCEYLVRMKNMSIIQTAMACGYNNVSYFNRSFKKYTGMTPKDFRCRFEKSVFDPTRFSRMTLPPPR